MRISFIGVTCTAAILSATLAASVASGRITPELLNRHLDAFPSRLGNWISSSHVEPLDPRTEEKLGATEYLTRTYRREAGSVDLFVAYYANQRAGESMHSPQNCLPGSGWEFWSRGVVEIPVGNRNIRVNRDGVQKDGSRAVVLYWYQTPERIFADEYVGKLYLVWDSITTRRANGSIVRLVVPDRPEAVDDAISLAKLVIPEVQQSFAK